MMDIQIKRATPNDAEVVALLARITFQEAFGYVWTDKQVFRKYLDTTFSVDKIRSSIQKENNIFFMGYIDGFPAGYVKMKLYSPYKTLSDSKPSQLQKIYVLNEFIGHKIGEKLQNAVFEEIEKQSIQTLWLAVWDKNEKAIRFYEKHGFFKESQYHFDFETLGFDYHIMVKHF
jgi:diamine N-acetyltransferase